MKWGWQTMNKIQVTDEMLYQCMPVFGNKLLETLPSDETLIFEPSEQFQKNMEKLIKRAELKEKWGVPVQTWKRVAAAIIVALVGTLAVSMSVKAFREKVFEFIETIYQDHISTTYYQDAENEFKAFEVGYIPEGMKLVIDSAHEDYQYQSYEKQLGNQIQMLSITQQQILDGLVFDVDTEYVQTENCIIKGCPAELGYKDNGVIHNKWENEGCRWVVVAQEIDKEEVLKVCETLH